MDLRNEKIGFKIREHTLARVPYLLVIGDREVEQGQVAVATARAKDLGVDGRRPSSSPSPPMSPRTRV
jgi:threonyl-tRNA synthetase